jgi:antitoxin component of MazEF toxin-antitoxin module
MIEMKLRKIGDSLGVVLRKEAIARLSVSEGDRLVLTERRKADIC